MVLGCPIGVGVDVSGDGHAVAVAVEGGVGVIGIVFAPVYDGDFSEYFEAGIGRVGDGVVFYLDTQYTATVGDDVTVGCYGVIEHEGFCGVGGDEVAEAG